ncbi:serine/arginine-rich splicing factor 3 isoform X1 [Calypte anna]|uniref:serine/arginine-rich splicing factor 3 isoform X1 n=1 Tax=Calypte anna TaxID=9244 RepID=UPI0011C45BA4|nr:serine/arginine-rich splicing factor 3 isoform X1 [Calypte anna]
MLFSLSLLSNLNQIGSSHLDRPHIPGQSAQLFIYQMSSQQLQQQPSANKKAGKIHNIPLRQPTKYNATSGKTFSANSSWQSVRQPHLTISSLLKPKTNHHEGEASPGAVAGPSPETEEERGHSHGRGITSLLVPSPGPAVAPGQMRGNKTVGRSCVQEVIRSEDRRSMYRTFVLF